MYLCPNFLLCMQACCGECIDGPHPTEEQDYWCADCKKTSKCAVCQEKPDCNLLSVVCSSCDRFFHHKCLEQDGSDMAALVWECSACRCAVCGKTDSQQSALQCHVCERRSHVHCNTAFNADEYLCGPCIIATFECGTEEVCDLLLAANATEQVEQVQSGDKEEMFQRTMYEFMQKQQRTQSAYRPAYFVLMDKIRELSSNPNTRVKFLAYYLHANHGWNLNNEDHELVCRTFCQGPELKFLLNNQPQQNIARALRSAIPTRRLASKDAEANPEKKCGTCVSAFDVWVVCRKS